MSKISCVTRTVCGEREQRTVCLVEDRAPETLRSPGTPDLGEAREFAQWFTVEAGVEELRRAV